MTTEPVRVLTREAVDRVYRLRPLQEGMLFHDLASDGPSPYARQAVFRIEGDLDPATCEVVWNQLMKRHMLLRTVFDHARTAQPLQIVLKAQTVEFAYEDLTGQSNPSERIAAWRELDQARGFDLARDRLMRIQLFRLGPDRLQMVWSHSHILIDGWSGAVLLEEFGHLCAAAAAGRDLDAVLPPAPDPDAYLAAIEGRDATAADAYWRGLLAGYDELATLPRRADASSARHPSHHCFRIGADQTAGLSALAARHGATLATLLQALWALVLGRWTDRQDVVFGVVVSGRSLATPDIDRLVGMFINTLPVRVSWADEDTIGDLLRALQRQAAASQPHDHASLAQIQSASDAAGGLLDHLLVFENFPSSEGVDLPFRFTAQAEVEHANYDFGILVEGGETLEITFPFDAARMVADQMIRLERQIRTLIDRLLENPGSPLTKLDILPETERRRLLDFGAGPPAPLPERATLADLWAGAADRWPERVAVSGHGRRLSYRTLDAAAEGLAETLRGAGVAAGDVVGVLAERTPDRLVALLAVLKAGAAYLPLSPALPNERMAFMLDDARARCVLVDDMGAGRLAGFAPALARPIRCPLGAGHQPCPATPQDLAYVIYTSGSTGAPKGVGVRHAGFINMILAQIGGFGVTADDVVVQFASCSFDASLSEIFMALLAGARLVIASDLEIRDGQAFQALVAREGVTVATLPPSYLRALDGASLATIRVLITAGEPPDPDDVRRYALRLRYFNAYGPTEASVCASWKEVATPPDRGAPVSIGRPIRNTRMAVRGRDGRLAPLGAEGEIWLAGAGLAAGYIGQPALTTERFPTLDGETWYRTGDWGRLLESGEVLYLGRRDTQAKLNGYRIELGEIETALRAQPGVAQACVVVDAATPRLTAYVVADAAARPDDIRRALAGRLPSWMVPADIVALSELPRTLAGKLDRRALSNRVRDPPADGAEAALSATEARVAAAFTAVLGEASYAPTSSFAALGGDSLRAIRLLGRLRREGLAIELRGMLAADTVGAIARAAAPARSTTAPASAPQEPTPLAPIQRWFLTAHQGELAHFNHLVLLRASERIDVAPLAAALRALWQAHDALRMTFRCEGADWVQKPTPRESPCEPCVLDLRTFADPWPLVRADAERAQGTFDLETGPLFRATLYCLGEADYLLLNAHHLVVDAVSWRLIVEDLGQALREAANGGAVRAPAAGNYHEAAVSRLRWGESSARGEEAYWATVEAAPAPPLPLDFSGEGASIAHSYHDTEVVEIDLGATPPRLSDRAVVARLLSAVGQSLTAWDGRRLAVLALANHGRQPVTAGYEASRTIGWFTAEFPFLLECGASAETIETSLSHVPNGGLGWGALRWGANRVQPAWEPQISFNYQADLGGSPDAAFQLSLELPTASVGKLTRPRLLELEARRDDHLWFSIRYAPRLHFARTIGKVLSGVARAFRRADSALEHRGGVLP